MTQEGEGIVSGQKRSKAGGRASHEVGKRSILNSGTGEMMKEKYRRPPLKTREGRKETFRGGRSAKDKRVEGRKCC